MLSILEHWLHLKIFKNIILMLFYYLKTNLMEKNTKFTLTSKKNMSLLLMTDFPGILHPNWKIDTKMPKDMTSGPIHTDLHLFL